MNVALIWIVCMLAALSLGLFLALLAERDKNRMLSNLGEAASAEIFGITARLAAAEKELARRPLRRGAGGRFERAGRE